MNLSIHRATTTSLLLGLLLSTSACMKAAAGPVFARATVPPGQGVVHIYRPNGFSGGARSIYLSVPLEANNCYALDNDGFFTYVAAPGTLNVLASGSGESTQLATQLGAGEEKYIRASWGTWGQAEMEEVAPAEGAREIAGLRAVSTCAK